MKIEKREKVRRKQHANEVFLLMEKGNRKMKTRERHKTHQLDVIRVCV